MSEHRPFIKSRWMELKQNAVHGLMTHEKGVPYMDYVRGIKENPIAAAVKLADLKHNSDLTRLDHIDDKVKQRAEKYKKAIELLRE